MVTVTIKETKILDGEVLAPPSKSYTQRMLIASSLSSGFSKISKPLLADDTKATLRAVKALGAKVKEERECWTVMGTPQIRGAQNPIDCGDSAATLRFMIPIAALAAEPSIFLSGSSLERRPIKPLLDSLKQLGAETSIEKIDSKSAVKVYGGGIKGGKTKIPGDVSSQFLSGLIFACPLSKKNTDITLTTPLESREYIQMTCEVLSKHGIKIDISKNFGMIQIPGGQVYKPCNHWVPGDFSSTAFLLAAAAITRSNVKVGNLDFNLAQGDKKIISILEKMGAKLEIHKNNIEIKGNGELLNAFVMDAGDTPDLVPICAALACYSRGTSRILNAKRLKLKESDRLLSTTIELGKMGADISADMNSLTIKGPCKLRGTDIDPHRDHRIAMACAIAALGAEGETTIHDAESVKKSYPRFFIDLTSLGVDVVGGKFDR